MTILKWRALDLSEIPRQTPLWIIRMLTLWINVSLIFVLNIANFNHHWSACYFFHSSLCFSQRGHSFHIQGGKDLRHINRCFSYRGRKWYAKRPFRTDHSFFFCSVVPMLTYTFLKKVFCGMGRGQNSLFCFLGEKHTL